MAVATAIPNVTTASWFPSGYNATASTYSTTKGFTPWLNHNVGMIAGRPMQWDLPHLQLIRKELAAVSARRTRTSNRIVNRYSLPEPCATLSRTGNSVDVGFGFFMLTLLASVINVRELMAEPF